MRPCYFSEEHYNSKPKNTAHKSKAKHKKEYDVYTNSGKYAGSTMAVSEAQAINNVRHNTKGDYVGNNGFYAIES